MSAPNRSGRPISYRKRRRGVYIRIAVFSAVITLFIAAIAFLLIGNHLLKKTSDPDSKKDEPSVSEPQPSLPQRPHAIQAQAVSVSSLSASRFAELQNAGISSISIHLNNSQGALLYRSPIAVSLGMQSSATALPTLSDALSSAASADIYVSAVFYLTAFSEENDLLRSTELARSASLIAEAVRDGVDDVTVLIPDLTLEYSEELLSFLLQIRTLESSAVLGIAVNRTVLTEDSAPAILKEWNQAVNYLAMDLTQESDESFASHIDACLNDAQVRYYLLYYQMRLLLPEQTDASETITVVRNHSFENWQFIAVPSQ